MSQPHTLHRPTVSGTALTLIAVEAASLAVISSLHLSGLAGQAKPPYSPASAGIAEAVIGFVLLGSLAVNQRRLPFAWTATISAVCFAIIGFIIGLTFTLRGGTTADVAYHATVLPLLAITLALLLRERPPRDTSAAPRTTSSSEAE